MKYKKFAATAMLAVAATGIAAGTSGAAPAPAVQGQAAPAVQGADHGVNYAVQLVDRSIVAAVTGGTFTIDADQKYVTVKNTDGAVVTSIPLKAQVGAQLIPIGASIDPAGQQLTLTPQIQSSAAISAEAISSQEWFFSELQRASLGALIGAIIGFFFFGVGLPVGALIGLLIAGGPNLINAGIAYFSGQP